MWTTFHQLRLPLGLVLLAISAMLALIAFGTGSVIVDGFQSLGAIAGPSQAGALRWPMLSSFLGYDHVWGFHWIGWPWLRSLLAPMLPWKPELDLGICGALWGVTGWWISGLAEKQDDRIAGIGAGLGAVLAPGFLVAAQSYRPEIPTALALVMAASVWDASSRRGRLLRVAICVILPTLHPLGLVVPGSWCLFELLRNLRESGSKAILSVVKKSVPLLIGAGLMVAWLAFQPEALAQFKLNLKSQRMLIDGLGTGYSTFFRWGIGSIGALPLVVLLAGAVTHGAWLILQSLRRDDCSKTEPVVLAGVGVITALVFNIAAKNPNVLHLVAILPLAAWLFISQLRLVRQRLGMKVYLAAVMASLVLFSALSLKQGWKLVRNPGAGFRASLSNALESLPETRKILIPVAMWEAAIESPRRPGTAFQFSTFPNLLPNAEREAYEKLVMSETRTGDLLIWDPLQDEGGIFNFVTATALKHQVLRPPDDPDGWERLPDLQIPVIYSQGQPARFELYRKR